MYKRQLISLAENVFKFDGLGMYLDESFLNKSLLHDGSIAFFKDEYLGLLALPYVNIGNLDIYGRPTKIRVMGQNGYNRVLNRNEFVIMYDNNSRYPMYLDIVQYSERLALIKRTQDINIYQQRTTRFWKTPVEKERSVKDMINNVDGFNEAVITYEDINLDETTLVLEPAPYIAGSLDERFDKEFNEYLRLIGISNMTYQKKERQIRDEVSASLGGTIASRYNRFNPRAKACLEIKEKFGIDIIVSYYDDLPTNMVNPENDEEVDIDESVQI
ncbi:MAG: hypothetical protein MJ224_01655 [archaeon]|nr:hypothetical protein [archaeon]